MFVPLMVNLSNQKILIVGAGKMARQKIKNLALFNVDFTILCPYIPKDLALLAKNCIYDDYNASYLKNFNICIACTDDSNLNSSIKEDAQNFDILFSDCSNFKNSDFYLPAILQKEDISISISTQGKSPSLSKAIKNQIKTLPFFSKDYPFELLEKIRDYLKFLYKDMSIKKEILSIIYTLKEKELLDFYNDLNSRRMPQKIVIGSRGSRLALVQTNFIISKLKEYFPDLETEIVVIKTKGDKILNKSLDKFNDKGLFVKEIEEKLIDNTIDFAVHSMKDMPSENPDGLIFAPTPKRESPKDVLILKSCYKTLDDLPIGSKIATGSKRRSFQLLKLRPDLDILPIRGNIDTRIQKIDNENLDGIILAHAGILRLKPDSLSNKNIYEFSLDEMIPATSQGALAIEYKKDRIDLKIIFDKLKDFDSEITTNCERSFLKEIQGGCHSPVGAYCWILENKIFVRGIFGNEDGSILKKYELFEYIDVKNSSFEELILIAQNLGKELAKILKNEVI